MDDEVLASETASWWAHHEKRKLLQIQDRLEQAIHELVIRGDPILIPEILEPLREALAYVQSLTSDD